MEDRKKISMLAGIFFIFARLILFVSSPYEVIPGYGDYWNFFHQSSLGWPFLDYWTEFPPLFPYIAKLLFIMVDGREIAFGYGLGLLISLFQAGTVVLMFRLEDFLDDGKHWPVRSLIYAAVTVGLFYSWSYFDPLGVFFMMLGIYLLLEEKDLPASLAIAAGVLTKWFPGLILPALWKKRSKKEFLKIIIIVVGIIVIVWGALFVLEPDFTKASLTSQANKGSWETVWAILDGNLKTGNFAPEVDRAVAQTAALRTGNSAQISPWISLLIFGGTGLYFLIRADGTDKNWLIPFTGFTMTLFFLWSPGYSPQWILYLLPLMLLSLPLREGVLVSAVLILVNLLEWPVMLSRGFFWSLNILIPLRTALMVLVAVRFYQTSLPALSTRGELPKSEK